MLDIHLEPDDLIRYAQIFSEYFDDIEKEPSDEEIEIALHNYECSVYNELDKRIWSY